MSNKMMVLLGVIFCIILMILYIVTYNLYFDNAPSKLRKVNLRIPWETQCQFAGYYVAKDKGYYADEGLDVIIRTSLSNVNIASVVAMGHDDFGVVVLHNVIMDIDRGFPVVNVAQILQSFEIILLTRTEDKINTLADFNGKLYASWWGQNDMMLKTLFKKQNIPFNVIIYPKPWSLDLFIDKKVHITPAFHANEYHTVLQSGYKPEDLHTFSYADYGMNFPGDSIIVSRQKLKDDPNLVLRFVRATIKGWEYALANKIKSVDIMMKYAKLDREHEIFMINSIHNDIVNSDTQKYTIGYHNKKSIQNMIDMLKENNQISKDLKVEDVYTDIIISQLLSEALK